MVDNRRKRVDNISIRKERGKSGKRMIADMLTKELAPTEMIKEGLKTGALNNEQPEERVWTSFVKYFPAGNVFESFLHCLLWNILPLSMLLKFSHKASSQTSLKY